VLWEVNMDIFLMHFGLNVEGNIKRIPEEKLQENIYYFPNYCFRNCSIYFRKIKSVN